MRVPLTFKGKRGHVVLDQLRTVDKSRLLKKLGKVSATVASEVSAKLQEMFSLQAGEVEDRRR